MKKIVIIGASGHAKVIIDIIEKRNEYQIIGLIDSYKNADQKIMGYTILGKEDLIPELIEKENIVGGVIAIGDNWSRNKVKDTIKKIVPEFKFLPAVHPNAVLCNNLKIAPGVVIMAGAIVNAEAKIAPFCILNTKSSLGHDSVMDDFSSLAPNTTIGGNVSIGEFSAVSIGSTVIQNVKIGMHTIVGAGTLVLEDIGNNLLVYGVPGKKIRDRQIGEPYLAK